MQDFIGHGSYKTTQKYIHLTDEDRMAAAKALHGFQWSIEEERAMSKAKKSKPTRHRKLPAVPNVFDAYEEMDTADARTSAIVGLAFLENNLALAIMARLREMTDTEQEELFEGPLSLLSSFSSKVEIAYALNLFTQGVRHDLKLLSKVRNRFAHFLEVSDFDHPEVSKSCDKLIGPKYLDRQRGLTQPRTRRDMFSDTIAHLIERFAMIAGLPASRPQSPTHIIREDY